MIFVTMNVSSSLDLQKTNTNIITQILVNFYYAFMVESNKILNPFSYTKKCRKTPR